MPASAATVSQDYPAVQGETYECDQLISDSGTPDAPGAEGDLFQQLLQYQPIMSSFTQMATVQWDDETQYFVGLDVSSSTQQHSALLQRTVQWRYGGGSWQELSSEALYRQIVTTVSSATPLLLPREYVAPPGGGGGGSYLSDAEIQELIMAGALDALRENLNPNYSFDGLTRDQLQRDLQALENILAGIPEPGTWALVAVGLLVVSAAVAARRREGQARPDPHAA